MSKEFFWMVIGMAVGSFWASVAAIFAIFLELPPLFGLLQQGIACAFFLCVAYWIKTRLRKTE